MNKFDWYLVILTIIIFSVGMLFQYSASYQKYVNFGQNLFLRQLVWAGLGLILAILIFIVGHRRILSFAYPLYAVSLIALIAVLIMGRSILGAQRWISLGWFNFQPSELAKISLIVVLANYLGHNKEDLYSLKSLLRPGILTVIPMILILKEPDLGTALTFVPIFLAIAYVAGTRARHILAIIGSGIILSPLFWSFLKTYQKQRLLVFVNPNIDPLGAGYTIIQSKIAIGSGRLFGKGWLAGTQNQLNFLPERHTDFIFSVAGEEWGFLGAALLLGLFFLFIQRMFVIAANTENPYSRLMVVGLATMLTFQILVNIGMSMGLLPVVGLTLPLISYGGSSLVISLVSVALILDVTREQ